MGYTVDYSGMTPEQQADKAIKDCEQWLGGKAQLNKVTKHLGSLSGQCNEDFAYFYLEFQGIRGLPARVLVERHFTPQMSLNLQ